MICFIQTGWTPLLRSNTRPETDTDPSGSRRLSSRDCGEDLDSIAFGDLRVDRRAIQFLTVYE